MLGLDFSSSPHLRNLLKDAEQFRIALFIACGNSSPPSAGARLSRQRTRQRLERRCWWRRIFTGVMTVRWI